MIREVFGIVFEGMLLYFAIAPTIMLLGWAMLWVISKL